MFDIHSDHEILSLGETAKYLRNLINREAKKGTLNKSHAEAHLLEIREYLNRLEKYGLDALKKVEDTFKHILDALKARKTKLFSLVLVEYNDEKEKILLEEDKWNRREAISLRLKEIALSPDDSNLLIESKFIVDGMNELDFDVSYYNVKLLNTVNNLLKLDRTMHFTSDRLTVEELSEYLEEYYELTEPTVLDYKS